MKLNMGDALLWNAQRFPNKLALDEGYLHVSGRKKSMIKSAGISIFPEEIEGVLRAHADLAEVAVFACRHPEWGESVKALVIPKTGAIVEPDRIIQYCKDFLAP